MSVENRADEIILLDTVIDEPHRIRSSRVIRLHDFVTKFLETAYYQGSKVNYNSCAYLRLYYYDQEEIGTKSSNSTFYRVCYFSMDFEIIDYNDVKHSISQIKR